MKSTMNRSSFVDPNGAHHQNNEIVPETVYQSVLYGDNLGTLKLSDKQLSFHTPQKVSVLPWEKVVKRQVLSTKSTSTTDNTETMKHKTKLILASGNEAIFTVEDRVSLEVLRDDLAERLQTWRKNYKPAEDGVVNKTVTQASGRRMSTPYRFVSASTRDLGASSDHKPKNNNDKMMDRSLPSHLGGGSSRRMSNNNKNGQKKKKDDMDWSTRSEPAQQQRRDSSYRFVSKPKQKDKVSKPTQQRRESTPYRFVSANSARDLGSSSTTKKNNKDTMMDSSTRSEPPLARGGGGERRGSDGSYRFVSKPKQDASPKQQQQPKQRRSSAAAASSTTRKAAPPPEAAPQPRRRESATSFNNNTTKRKQRRNSLPDVIYL